MRHIDTEESEPPEPVNPFPYATVAWSCWESENNRRHLHKRTLALLTGELEPQNEQDREYLRDMGGVKGARAGWPKKWCVCGRCHAEWQATGFPAPMIGHANFALTKFRFGSWLFPGVCEICDEELRAVKAPPAKDSHSKTKPRTPYAEPDEE